MEDLILFQTNHSSRSEQLRRRPLGCIPRKGGGADFAVWAPDAEKLIVHIFDRQDHELRAVSLPERSAGVWFGFVDGLMPGACYALEALGEYNPEEGLYFRQGRLLVDPYTKALSRPFVWDARVYECEPDKFVPRCLVPDFPGSFDWQGVAKPELERREVVLYEANVKGLTMLNPDVPPEWRGKYLGLGHPAVIRHLKQLGITAIQLNPVAASMSEPRIAEKGLSNLWGYNPVCFMAPDPRFAVDPFKVVKEFQTMVRELHRSGIAVVLDVVFNHTAEGGPDGPVLCYRGLDNRRYYAFERDASGKLDYSRIFNTTGCGNSFNCDERSSLHLVLDTLHYWLEVMQVDGFRFDEAVTVCRETHGSSIFEFEQNSAFLKSCFCSTAVSGSILIAEPWDVGHNGYRMGQFPGGWGEQNDRFRDVVRRFWRGDPGLLGEFATRIMGSKDFFYKGQRSLHASFNYVTYHDGFTLEDLVSYSRRHNYGNGEGNQDGSPENFSCNCGHEGPTTDPQVLARRRRLKRCLLATTLLSQGTPVLLYGDEFSRTQQGNNNAYCQDNEISYLKWDYSPENLSLIDFISNLIRLRHSSVVLSELHLEDDNFHIWQKTFFARWYRPNGIVMDSQSWNDPEGRTVMLHFGERVPQDSEHSQKGKEQWCILFNGSTQTQFFTPPAAPHDMEWMVFFDTSLPDGLPDDADRHVGMSLPCQPVSFKLLGLEEHGGLVPEERFYGLYRHGSRYSTSLHRNTPKH